MIRAIAPGRPQAPSRAGIATLCGTFGRRDAAVPGAVDPAPKSPQWHMDCVPQYS